MDGVQYYMWPSVRKMACVQTKVNYFLRHLILITFCLDIAYQWVTSVANNGQSNTVYRTCTSYREGKISEKM